MKRDKGESSDGKGSSAKEVNATNGGGGTVSTPPPAGGSEDPLVRMGSTLSGRGTERGRRSPGGSSSASKQWREAAGDTAPEKAPVVVLADFVGARAPETMVMAARCTDITVGGSKSEQKGMMLLRRRAASFKPYKFPLSVRINPKSKRRKLDGQPGDGALGGAGGSATFCRARRRSRKALATRQGAGGWLETHMWHAKRFNMREMWGYSIAESRRDAGERAACRWASEHCVIHDASYTACMELRGWEDPLCSAITRAIRPVPVPCQSGALPPGAATSSCIVGPASPVCVRGGMEVRGIIHGPKGIPIGPCSVMWMPAPAGQGAPAARVVWVWVHPACYADAHSALQEAAGPWGVEVGSLCGSFSRFELRGHESVRLASRLITPGGQRGPAEELWDDLQGRQTACLPDGASIVLQVMDPRLVKPAPHHPRRAAAIRPLWPPSGEAGGSSGWSSAACAVRDEWACGGAAMSDAEVQRVRKHGPVHANGSGHNATPVMLVWRAGGQGERGGCQGWDLVVQKGWGGVFWKAAVLAGGRAVGQREREVVAREWGGSVYPQDYPQSPAGWAWHDEESANKEEEWARKPPGFRPPRREAYPFGGGKMWEELAGRPGGAGLVRLRLAVRGRGRPLANAAVMSAETGKLIGFVLAGGYSRRLGRGWGDALARAADVAVDVDGVSSKGGGMIVKLVNPGGREDGEFPAWARAV